jgi:hypothetical protein
MGGAQAGARAAALWAAFAAGGYPGCTRPLVSRIYPSSPTSVFPKLQAAKWGERRKARKESRNGDCDQNLWLIISNLNDQRSAGNDVEACKCAFDRRASRRPPVRPLIELTGCCHALQVWPSRRFQQVKLQVHQAAACKRTHAYNATQRGKWQSQSGAKEAKKLWGKGGRG